MNIYRATSDVVACSLTPDELRETQAAWEKLIRLSLVAREEVPGGLKLEVHPESAEALRQLIDVERECCPWITFQLDGPVAVMTADGPGEEAIRQMWRTES